MQILKPLDSISKPIHRGRLRRWAGKRYFISKRKWAWYFGNVRYAKNYSAEHLAHTIMEHQSILLRQLKDVDMWLQHNKVTNLRLAISALNGLIIRPGETFSFWYLVGKPSKSKGYLPGMTLQNGLVGQGTGGGLCQLGNLLFWMVLHSPLSVTERWRHSFDVFPDVKRTLPFGSGATLSYNYIDFQFKNETKADFQVHLHLDDSHLKGRILSNKEVPLHYQVYEKDHLFRGETWGGYTRHNRIFRKISDKKTKVVISDELLIENHAIMMYQPFLE